MCSMISMQTEKRNIIAVSYAKKILVEGSREQKRMLEYAQLFGEYHIIVFTKANENLPKLYKNENLRVHATHANSRLGMVWSAITLGRNIIRQTAKKYTVTSQDPFETSFVARWITLGNSSVHHIQIHGDVFNSAFGTGTLLSWMRNQYAKRVVKKVKKLRVVSQRIKQSLLALGVEESKITVLPVQQSLADFLEAGKIRKYEHSQPLRFLYVGRFAEEKNIPLLIESFHQFLHHNESATLTLVGEGPDEDKIRRFIKKIDRTKNIRIESWTESVSEKMSTHDVFCLSSNHEGWAMVLVEAAAAGMCVVSTDVGCAGEFIKNNQNGLVVPVADTDSLTNAFVKVFDDPEKRVLLQKNAHVSAYDFVDAQQNFSQALVDSYSL